MTSTIPHPNIQQPSASDPLVAVKPIDTPEVSLLTVFVVLLRHRWLIVLLAALGSIIFGFQAYNPVPTYTAVATFTPRQQSQSGSGSALLQQLGLGGGGGGGNAYYLDLIKSREILGPVVTSTYTFSDGKKQLSGTLIQLYGISDPRPRYAKAHAMNAVADHMKTASSLTGIMTLGVTEAYPALAPLVAAKILEELNRFNLENRQEQASAERRFIADQMEESGIRLRIAEDDLQRFLDENRNFSEVSPLSFQWDRLKRTVNMRQELFTALAKQLDQAKIEEVRDSPVLTVLEPADVPLGPDPSVWRGKALLGAGVGAMFGILIAFVHSYFARRREAEMDDYAEFIQLKRQAVKDLTQPWKPLGRIFATGRT